MRLNFKTIIVGGIVFYVAQFIVSMITGVVIHEGVLDPLYRATTEYWRPELVQQPPDMAALMPRWIGVGLVMAFIFAGIYDNIRDSFNGSGVIKGLKFGVVLTLIAGAMQAGWSGVFNLPETIWAWWFVDSLILFCVGGIALGWFVGKWGSD